MIISCTSCLSQGVRFLFFEIFLKGEIGKGRMILINGGGHTTLVVMEECFRFSVERGERNVLILKGAFWIFGIGRTYPAPKLYVHFPLSPCRLHR